MSKQEQQRKTITVSFPSDVPDSVPQGALVGCLAGSSTYHVTEGNEEHVGGTWRAKCSGQQGSGHRAGVRDTRYTFRLCRACVEACEAAS